MKVSAIIPVYNGEATIARAIGSVLAQNFPGCETIVVDDGSSDSTAAILQELRDKIRIIRQENRGPSAARNAAAAAAGGEYLAFLDADDEWLPQKLRKTVEPLEINPDSVLAFSDYIEVDNNSGSRSPREAGPAPSMADLLTRIWGIVPSTAIIRASAFHSCGGFPLTLPGPGFEDPYLWLRARELGSFQYVAEPLVAYCRASSLAKLTRYEAHRAEFRRMTGERYGRAAKALAGNVDRMFAVAFMQYGLEAADARDYAAAFNALRHAFRLVPGHMIRLALARLLRRKNLARAAGVLRLRNRAARKNRVKAAQTPPLP